MHGGWLIHDAAGILITKVGTMEENVKEEAEREKEDESE